MGRIIRNYDVTFNTLLAETGELREENGRCGVQVELLFLLVRAVCLIGRMLGEWNAEKERE